MKLWSLYLSRCPEPNRGVGHVDQQTAWGKVIPGEAASQVQTNISILSSVYKLIFSSLDKEHFDRNPYTCKCTYKWGILLISSVLNFIYYSISQISRSSEQITCVIYHLQFTISSITGPYGFYTDRRYLMMNSGYLWIYLDIYIYIWYDEYFAQCSCGRGSQPVGRG